jgi:hypothetical protein
MNYPFLLAGGASAFAFIMHVLIGRSRSILPPRNSAGDRLLEADAWYGRHVTTLVLGAMALGFAHASRRPDAWDLATALTALAFLLALLRIGLAARSKAPRLDIGEWGFIALAGVFGEAGLLL